MKKIITILLFIIVSLAWGTTFIAMKIALNTIPPLFTTGMRFLLASLFLIYLCYQTNTSLFFPEGKNNFQLIICIFYFSIPFTLMLYGSIYINSIIASVIFSSMPIIILLFSSLFFKKKLYTSQFIGLISAILSLLVILFKEVRLGDEKTIVGIIALILALLCHSVVYLYSQEKYSNISVLTFNALPSLFSGIFMLLISNFIEHPTFNNFSNTSILAVLYLSYFSGIFGILSYFYLQKKVSSFYASSVFFIFPLITVILEKYMYGNVIKIDQLKLISFLVISVLLTLIPLNFKK